MPKLRLSIVTVDAPVIAAQPFSGKYLFKLGEAASIADNVTQADFDVPPDGTYPTSCQSLDVSGAPIADLVTGSVTLSGGQVVDPNAPPAPAPAPAPQTYPAPSAISAQIVA